MHLLHLETATTVCSVALSRNNELLFERELNEANRHAEVLTVFCRELIQEAGLSFSQLDGVCVSKGPGSYTGLRIGVSAAKGFCYALNIPLLAVNTLESLAEGMRLYAPGNALLCPMLDARRMEVYCALYNLERKEITPTAPVIIDVESFSDILQHQPVLFAGDGMPKCRDLLQQHPNAYFANCLPAARNMIHGAVERFKTKQFEDLAWFEPFYLKTFQPGPKRSAN